MKKYPLLLKPVLKDYLWGGTRLKEEYGFETEKDIVAEGWMLASHKDGTNVVMNGEYAGRTFDEVLRLWGMKKTRFPILIKLIDAKDKLSIQVHPEDSYAYREEGEPGKTEMWYVVDCEEGARLAYGFTRSMEQAELEMRIRNNCLDEVINYVSVRKGDVFFIAAGTLHAIGEGLLIAEVQQNSNTTYRVSDYGRLGADGKPRELHIEKALAVTKAQKPQFPYGQVGKVTEYVYGNVRELAECEYFKVDSIQLNGTMTIDENVFVSLLVLDGEMTLNYEGGIIVAQKGSSIYIPERERVTLIGKGELLYSLRRREKIMWQENPFETISTEKITLGRFTVISDRVKINGKEFPYDYLEIKEGVCVLPIHENNIVTIKQYRYPVRSWQRELPGGFIDPGETPERAAERELLEETGYLVKELVPLGTFHPSFGSTNEKIYLFQAICSEQCERQLDESEVINIEEIPCEQFKELVFSGEFMHGAGIAAWARYPGEK